MALLTTGLKLVVRAFLAASTVLSDAPETVNVV
jgi:hypothetical protein